jgi:hypothetical protein
MLNEAQRSEASAFARTNNVMDSSLSLGMTQRECSA